jgi:hypothetical protein
LAMGAVRLRSITANRRRSRAGKWSGSTISSPRTLGWPKLGRGNCRSGRTARAGGGGRGGSASATAIAQPGQQAAREGPMGSREGAWAVARPWEAEGRSSTAAARMARWGGGVSTRRGKMRDIYRGGSAGMMTA